MSEFESFQQEYKFRCRPQEMFGAFTNAQAFQMFTQSPAQIEVKVGGKISFFGGAITGEIVELEQDAKIVEKWRFNDWADNVYSIVKLEFSTPSYGITVVKLTHSNIPSTDKFGNFDVAKRVADGWKTKHFEPISKFLGYAKYDEEDDD